MDNQPSSDVLNIQDEKQIERLVGIETYSTSAINGIGGLYKYTPKDFIVKEIVQAGQVLEIKADNITTSFSEETKDKYTNFNLVKINKETFEAIKMISYNLRIPVDAIHYSGLKDKCSISVQRMSIKGNYIEPLKKLKLKDISIRNIYPSRKSVKLGSHWGNHFIITIRNIKNIKSNQKRINKILKILQNEGFPNYYGLQRFGTFRPNSHLIGRYILEDKFKEAFEEFVLNTYSTESQKSQLVREELRTTGNYEDAFESFPNSLNYEKSMIKYLIDYPEDYKGAIEKLPDYLKKLLISAFQSYLFNKMLSLRVKRGLSLFKPVKGDRISILDDINGHCTKICYIYGKKYDKYLDKALNLVRAAIIIPLVGYDTNLDEYPLMKKIVQSIFKEEGISENIFNKNLLKEYEFKGAFRPMLIKPIGLKIFEYNNDEIFGGKYKLKLEFSLQKGSYATILLRELMK